MVTRTTSRAARRAAAAVRLKLGEDLRRLIDDSGITIGALSRASGVAKSYISDILAGRARPSIETYAKLAVPLGADLSSRLYPNTGPLIRDRHQARILEWLLEQLHSRWHAYTEVAVRKPVRGSIDAVLHDARQPLVVATEIESGIRRLEQQVRWHEAKTDALPSWPGWAQLGEEPPVSRLLTKRRTRSTRSLVAEFAGQLRAAYPAHPDDAIAALTGRATWPGPTLLWVTVDARGVAFAPGR